MAKITINDVEYESDLMNETALANVKSIQFVDTELAKLQAQVAVMKTARLAYEAALKQSMLATDVGVGVADADGGD